MNKREKSPLAFFLLGAVLYAPFVLFSKVEVLPNVGLVNFAALVPMISALILVCREKGIAGAWELLKRSADFRRAKSRLWYLPVFFLYPAIVFAQYGLALLSGVPAPSPHFSFWMPILFGILFIAALGEELGWMGYAFEPMRQRFGTLLAALLLGASWAIFHIPLFSASAASPVWILWQCLYIAASRVLFVWLYSNTGKSLFAVSMLHASFNMGWQLFPPSRGLLVPSFYDPRNLAITVIVMAAMVTVLWGPKTLARFRFTHRREVVGESLEARQ